MPKTLQLREHDLNCCFIRKEHYLKINKCFWKRNPFMFSLIAEGCLYFPLEEFEEQYT